MASENEKCETVEDIVAQMHKESKKERTVTRPDGYGGYEEITLEGNPHLKNLADRIETARKQESKAIATEHAVLPAVCITRLSGNAAAMREALDAALKFIGNLEIEPYSPLDEDASELRQRIMDALSAPPRNCDVGTFEEQRKRFKVFCRDRQYGLCDGCPVVRSGFCTLQWAQMPYEAEEGGAK